MADSARVRRVEVLEGQRGSADPMIRAAEQLINYDSSTLNAASEASNDYAY